MIEDVLIWKFVAEHQPLHKSQLEPGILDRDCAHRRANCSQSRNLNASRVADADALDEQLETVSAQIAPVLLRSLEIRLPHGIRISASSRLDCAVWYFYYGQAIESTGAAKH